MFSEMHLIFLALMISASGPGNNIDGGKKPELFPADPNPVYAPLPKRIQCDSGKNHCDL